MKLTPVALHTRAQPCDLSDPIMNFKLGDDLLRVMHNSKGIGLAATQVGASIRVFVMGHEGVNRVCFNPEIVDTSTDQVDYDEGCLSFPGEHCIIKRPSEIQVRYYTPTGSPVEETLNGIWARCFQHELDHLNGITMWDRYKEQNAKQS